MPYSFNLLDEEENQQQGGQAPITTGGGQGMSDAPTAQNVQGPKPEKGAAKGSGFVGLDKYMNANKGSQFGQQFVGNVQGTVQDAQNKLTQGATQFQDASKQGALDWNAEQERAKSLVDTAGDNLAQEDTDYFKRLSGGQYQGPDSFLNSSFGLQSQGAVNKAAQQGKALQSEGGRFALLDQYYGRPKYSQGEKTLDNLLVQNAPGLGGKTQAIGRQATELVGKGAQTEKDMNNLVAQNRAMTEAAGQQARDYLGQARTGFETDLTSRYKDYGKGVDKYNKALLDDIQDTTLDAETMKALGLKEGQSLYGVDLGKYINTDGKKASLGQFASDEDYARSRALSQLAGEDDAFLGSYDREKAGTGSGMGRASVDKDALAQALGGSEKKYKAAVQQAEQDVSSTEDLISRLKKASSGQLSDTDMKKLLGDEVYSQVGNNAYAQSKFLQSLQKQLEEKRSTLAALGDQYNVKRKVKGA